MLAAVPADEQAKVKQNFYRVAATSSGMYPLVDYVNFKGEGTSPTERYQGQGWGLLQVLETMNDGPALEQFRNAAAQVLTRRVHNSPAERHEERWLPGWLSRVRNVSVGRGSRTIADPTRDPSLRTSPQYFCTKTPAEPVPTRPCEYLVAYAGNRGALPRLRGRGEQRDSLTPTLTFSTLCIEVVQSGICSALTSH